jgi:hypothetical protein
VTTKPPSPVNEFPAESLEKIAYSSVSFIPTQEPNDQTRLAYYVWDWLKNRRGTLEQAVAASGSRMKIPQQEAVKIIEDGLRRQGVRL